MARLKGKSDIQKFFEKSKEKMMDVAKQAALEIAREASIPVASGGNMPVDTSFLKNTMIAAINEIPNGPSDPKTETAFPQEVSVVIARAKPGDEIIIGWTAHYARHMEAMFSFVGKSTANFDKRVENIIRRIK